MGVMICLSQGCLRSHSASSSYFMFLSQLRMIVFCEYEFMYVPIVYFVVSQMSVIVYFDDFFQLYDCVLV